ncbi:unnamed protein product [Dicrocoelium dendriticum]|nr:unnamed protein product [Dicrocoelium dendriticum]
MEYAVDQLTDCQAQMLSYWETVRLEIESIKCDHSAFKTQDLPLARIKKIMKLDDEIKSMMISAEAPILFAKAAELFIRELTLRAWIHTERNRRRTLQRNDIAMAVSDGDTDQFDFLIDIVPREEVPQTSPPSAVGSAVNAVSNVNMKSENTSSPITYVSATNGRASGQLGSADSHVSSPQSQAMAIALGGANIASIAQTRNVLTTPTIVQQGPTQTIQFAATIPSTSATGTVQSSVTSTAATAISNANTTVASAATAAAPIQYVLQLPMGAAGAASGQPFHIQLLPQHFQTSSTDALSAAAVAAAGQTGTLLTDANGNSIPVVQVVAPTAGGFSLPTIVQDANGQRTQLVQLQMPEASTGRPTLFLQQSGSVLGATALLAGGTLDGHSHRIAYNIQPQQLLSPTDVVTGDVASQVLLSFTDSGTTCMISSDASGSHCLDATDALEDVSNRDPHELVEEPGAEDDSAQVEATNSPTHSVVEHASLIAVTKQTEVDFELDSQVTQQELLRPVVPLSPTGEVELHGLNSGLISDDSVKTKLMDSTTETPNMDDS